ncbi:hypothetical protein ZWY2020_012199 [Hordeum vulgare]|nr:hypothetical protein ZWY2020_012199 [Hordeum vulgare]
MASTRDESKQLAKRPRHDDAQAAPARVQLNPADCNLDFVVDHGGLRGHALHGGGFAYCWSGARATAGVRRGGRYCFGCRVVAEQPVEMDDTEACQRHLCRVGVSRGDDAVGSLGEAGGHSFAFESTGKLSHDGKLMDYGADFGVGDTVICAVDLDSRPRASIGFCKNREWLGEAQSFDAFSSEKGFGLVDAPAAAGPRPWESAMFPHVLLKNFIVEMQFGMEDGLEPVNGYQPWSSALAHGNGVYGPVFAEQKECEVLMMVGLPASGKTTWAEKFVRESPEKRFIIVGLNLALDQLKMSGLLSNPLYEERLDSWLDRAAKVVEGLMGRAASVPRNYIIDQTNLERIARIRLLNNFSSYGCKMAVVVFPAPAERKSRSSKRFIQTWKEVPDDTVNKMAANFALPMSKDMPGSMEPFDQVLFVELSRGDAQTYLDQMTSNRGSNAFPQDASARGWQSTSHNQMRWRSSVSDKQSSSNAPTEPSSSNAPAEKDKQVDSDFIVSKKFELAHEYEEMDREYKNIREMSRGGQASEAATDAAWAAFEARLDKCRAIQREIMNAKGDPQPIPEWFLLGKDFVRMKNLELQKELELAVESHKKFIKMSGRGHAPSAEIKFALAALEGHLNKCRAIQREIREARGDPVPIPEELLDYRQ